MTSLFDGLKEFAAYAPANLGISIVSVMISLLSLIVLWTGRKIDAKGTKYLGMICLSNLLLSLTYFLVAYFVLIEEVGWPLKLSVFGQFFSSALLFVFILVLLYHYLEKQNVKTLDVNRPVLFIASVIYIGLYVVNIFHPFLYYFDEENVFVMTDNYKVVGAIGCLFLVRAIVLLIKYRHLLERELIISLIFVIGCFILGVVLMSVVAFDIFGFLMAVSVFCMVMFVECALVERYIQNEEEYSKVQMKLLLNRIRPHFLFNALSSISQLCKQNPKRAAEMAKHFSEYLSKSMQIFGKPEPIHFKKELEYVKSYITIEQLRFGDDIRVNYSIETDDFVIPPMILQPLIENAIKHGLGEKENGGSLFISVRKSTSGHIISIKDDGVGFDIAKLQEKRTDRVHVGIADVRRRIDAIRDASFILESKEGAGTIAMVLIPFTYSEKYKNLIA